MREATYSEFAGFVNHVLQRLKREWAQGHQRSPEDFPERIPLDEWWEHFAAVEAPEALLSVSPHDDEAGKRGGDP